MLCKKWHHLWPVSLRRLKQLLAGHHSSSAADDGGREAAASQAGGGSSSSAAGSSADAGQQQARQQAQQQPGLLLLVPLTLGVGRVSAHIAHLTVVEGLCVHVEPLPFLCCNLYAVVWLLS